MNLLHLEHARVLRETRAVVADLSLELEAGEVLGILGPNGAGKSSLLRALVSLLPLEASRAELAGEPLATLDPLARARRVGYLPQSPQILWPLSVHDVVRLGRRPHAGLATPTEDATAVATALATFGLVDHATRDASRLSMGEQMRVHLARLAAGAPSLWLVDEPTAALDPRAQLQVLSELKRVASRGAGVMIVLHDLPLAARYCDRVLVMQEGREVVCAAPALALSDSVLAEVFGVGGLRQATGGLDALVGITELDSAGEPTP